MDTLKNDKGLQRFPICLPDQSIQESCHCIHVKGATQTFIPITFSAVWILHSNQDTSTQTDSKCPSDTTLVVWMLSNKACSNRKKTLQLCKDTW